MVRSAERLAVSLLCAPAPRHARIGSGSQRIRNDLAHGGNRSVAIFGGAGRAREIGGDGLLCRADHRLARGRKPLAWRELDGLRFAAFGPQTTLRRLVESIDGLPSNNIEPAYEVADVITLESLLEAGLAVAASFKLGTYRGRDRKLVVRPLVEPALTRTIALVTHAERVLSPAAANLIERTIGHLRRRTDGFRAAGVARAGAF